MLKRANNYTYCIKKKKVETHEIYVVDLFMCLTLNGPENVSTCMNVSSYMGQLMKLK